MNALMGLGVVRGRVFKTIWSTFDAQDESRLHVTAVILNITE